MEIVGKKSVGSSILYFVIGAFIAILATGLILFFIWIASNSDYEGEALPMVIFGVLFILLAMSLVGYGIYILKIPNDLIAMDDTEVFFLKNKQEIRLSDIESILPRRATGRGVMYTYGTIVIKTKDGNEYKQNLISNVEDVASAMNKKLRKS